MTPFELKVPEHGFTKAERAWLQNEVIEAMKTVFALKGTNTDIVNHPGQGQTINASDCPPCP